MKKIISIKFLWIHVLFFCFGLFAWQFARAQDFSKKEDLTSQTNNLIANNINQETFHINWQIYLGDIKSSSIAIGKDGTIYSAISYEEKKGNTSENKNGFFKINPIDGTKKLILKDNLTYGSPSIADDGTIYVSGAGDDDKSNKLFALRPNGTVKWTANLYVANPPAIANDGTLYFVENTRETLCMMKPDKSYFKCVDGLPKRPTNPSIGLGNIIYVGSYSNLYAFNPDLSIKWEKNICELLKMNENYNLMNFYSDPIIDNEGNIYIALQTQIVSFSSSGELKWNYDIGRDIHAPVIDSKGNIYFVRDSFMMGVNLVSIDKSGNERWQTNNGCNVSGYCSMKGPVIGKGDIIFFTQRNELFGLDDLKLDFGKIEIENILPAYPHIDSAGNIYIYPDRFFSIKVKNSSISDLNWPKKFHDLRNTSNINTKNIIESTYPNNVTNISYSKKEIRYISKSTPLFLEPSLGADSEYNLLPNVQIEPEQVNSYWYKVMLKNEEEGKEIILEGYVPIKNTSSKKTTTLEDFNKYLEKLKSKNTIINFPEVSQVIANTPNYINKLFYLEIPVNLLTDIEEIKNGLGLKSKFTNSQYGRYILNIPFKEINEDFKYGWNYDNESGKGDKYYLVGKITKITTWVDNLGQKYQIPVITTVAIYDGYRFIKNNFENIKLNSRK